METQNVIVYFQKSKNGFYYAVQVMKEAIIANFIRKSGLGCKCYSERNLGTCNEIVDDILGVCENAVVFYVEYENMYLSSVITNLLMQQDTGFDNEMN